MKGQKIFQKRLNLLQQKLKQKNLSAFLITNPTNIHYLTGFKSFLERESMLIVDQKEAYLYLPRLYQPESPPIGGLKIKIILEGAKLFEEILKQLKRYGGKIGFEAENLYFNEYKLLKKGISFLPKKDFVSELRIIKDSREILNIKKAIEITDSVFEKILKFIKPGITEKQIAKILCQLMENLGAQGASFEPIVAFGKNSSSPHHFSSNKKLRKNEPILLDFGAKIKGYCSDFTRVIYFGKAPELFKERYRIIQESQEKAFETIKAGIFAEYVYQKIFKSLGKEAKYFIHGAGHGVGLEIHERPFLKKGVKEILKEGMVFSIEPGIYYKNKYGIRIEDCGLITKKGFEIFSKTKRDLIEI